MADNREDEVAATIRRYPVYGEPTTTPAIAGVVAEMQSCISRGKDQHGDWVKLSVKTMQNWIRELEQTP